MNVQSKEYQENQIFKKLDGYVEFYDLFSDSVSSFVTIGVRSMLNIDTHVYTSMGGTLETISLILKNGRINDAFALLRKFHDSIILNIYTTLYAEDNLDIENFIVEKIENWLSGSNRNEMPDSRGMTNYIKDSKHFKEFYDLLNTDKSYKDIRDRTTDNMHYNFYSNVLLNDNKVFNEDRGRYLDLFAHDLDKLMILHLSSIFYCNSKYMSAGDHLEYLESGLTPPENSQYWVASYIQEIFSNLIEKSRPDIANLIKSNTYMELV